MIIIHKEVFFVNDDVSSLKKVKLRKIKLKTKHLVGSSFVGSSIAFLYL
jgi:hypothetical protein